MKISLVMAVGKDGLIGSNGGLPWYHQEDLAHFKELTSQKATAVAMGRKTYEGLPASKLPGRTKFVLSKNLDFVSDRKDVSVFNDKHLLLRHAEQLGLEELFIIGGKEIFYEFCGHYSGSYVSLISGDYYGDTFIDLSLIFRPQSSGSKLEINNLSSQCTLLKMEY